MKLNLVPMNMISKSRVGQLVFVRRRGLLNGKPILLTVSDVTEDGKFTAFKHRDGDGQLAPFCCGNRLEVADFEIVSPLETIPPNIDPATGRPKPLAQDENF